MKSKIFTSILMLFAIAMMVGAQSFERQWDKSNATDSKPAFVDGYNNRGIAATSDYLFVASRSPLFDITDENDIVTSKGKAVVYFDAKTGVEAGRLDVSIVVEGQFAINDVEVSDDGQILASNLALPPQADPFRSWQFKMYKWTDVNATPTLFIDYDNPQGLRIGDLFTVKGDLNAGAVIYAGVHGTTKFVRWEVVDGLLNPVPEIIELQGITETGNALQYPKFVPTGVTKNDPFYYNASAAKLRKFSADGATILEEIVPANFLPSNGVENYRDNSITQFMAEGQSYIAALGIPGAAASSKAEVKAVNVTNGLNSPTVEPFYSESLGIANNAQLNGDIASTVIDGEVWVFLLYSNSGFAAHKFVAPLPEVVVPVTAEGWRRGSHPDLDIIDGRASKPDWLNASSRGVAVGNGHIYVANSPDGKVGEIRVLDVTDGSYLNKKLNVGLLNADNQVKNINRIADVEVDDAGHILACNMRTDGVFNIYAWDDEDSAPYVLVSATGIPYAGESPGSLGWHQTSYYFDVKGDIKNDAVIIAARSNANHTTYRWVISAGVVQNGGVPTVTINGTANFGSFASAALETADPQSPIWVTGDGLRPSRFLADGTFKGTVPVGVAVADDIFARIRSTKYLEWGGKKYLFLYSWIWSGKQRLIDVSADDLSTLTEADVTSAGAYLGQVDMDSKWGDVDYFIDEDGSLNLVTLDTGNGIMLKRIPSIAVSAQQVANDKVSIYPNPASTVLNISHPEGVQQVDVLSVTGAVIKSVSNLSSQEFSIDDLTSGVYFLRVTTNENSVVVSKFIKK